jgi:NAD(P)H dehydrogenase (quinone)
VKSVDDVRVDIKRVPETMPFDVAKAAGVKLEQEAAIAVPEDLKNYDAILFGTPTRF